MNDEVLRHIQERFREFGRTMPEVNVRQAMVPEGAAACSQTRWAPRPDCGWNRTVSVVILLPGPSEGIAPMFERQVRPRLARIGGNMRLLHARFAHDRIAGIGSGNAWRRFTSSTRTRRRRFWRPRPAKFSFTRASGRGRAAAEKLLDEMVERMALALGRIYFDDGRVARGSASARIQENRATIAVAESCTGGMLAERLTNVPGSSSYFRGGVVSYSNELKSRVGERAPEIIEAKGAVSAEVALAMADGIRRQTGSRLGIGVTGIAGPGGGTPEKPVGLVHIAIADEKVTKEREFRFPGTRDRIRHKRRKPRWTWLAAISLRRAHGQGLDGCGCSSRSMCRTKRAALSVKRSGILRISAAGRAGCAQKAYMSP